MFLTYGKQNDNVLIVASSYQPCEISVSAYVYLKNYINTSSVMLKFRQKGSLCKYEA